MAIPLKSIEDEVLKEMEAVKHFIELAIQAQRIGYTKASSFFISEAKEDCEHALLYAREIDKYNNSSEKNTNIIDITKSYASLEEGAVDRISTMYKEASKKEMINLLPFISDMMHKHTEDAYRAKKMLQKINVLFSSDALSDIEEIFDNETEDNDK